VWERDSLLISKPLMILARELALYQVSCSISCQKPADSSITQRLEIRPKDYVSLRGIDYEDDTDAANGMHFVNGPAQNNTISDEDSDEDSDIDELSADTWSESNDEVEDGREDDDDSDQSASNTVLGEQNEDEQDELDESTDESHESHESHDEVDENESDLAREFQNISTVESTPLHCECANGFGWNDLHDDGRAVTKTQWQKWQKWVVKHCPSHDPPIPEDS